MEYSTTWNNAQSAAAVARHGVSRRGQPGAPPAAKGPHVLTGGHLNHDDELPMSTLALDGCVDWLAFTIFPGFGTTLQELINDIAEYLPGSVGNMERGAMGYTAGLVLPGSGSILWNNDRPEMGVHVQLPSKALRCVELSPQEVCEWVLLMGGKFTRIDVAIDSDRVTMADIIQGQDSGDLVSRSPDRQLIYNYKDGSQTLYVGSPKSRRRVRFYDKALEQKAKVGYTHEGIWTRCEVQFRREQAQMVGDYIARGEDLRDVIHSCVDFRDSSQNEKISRCDRLPWWAAWIGAAKRLSFSAGSRVVDEVSQAYRWVSKQVAPTLAFLDRALGSLALDGLIAYGVDRIPKHREQVLLAMGAT